MPYSFLKHLIIVKFIILFSLNSYAQSREEQFPGDHFTPPSPEASALGKYVSIPVSLYTGTPKISIPIWELKEGDITVPISLSYHASGNKVDEIAPRTGLGWSLFAGGVISRTIIGKADEYGIGGLFAFVNDGYTPDYLTNLFRDPNRAAEQSNIAADWLNCGDGEPDQFHFNFGNYTGKFVFNWEKGILVNSESKVKVEATRIPSASQKSFIPGFKITTEDGNIYSFEAVETTDLLNLGPSGYLCNYDRPPVTSWYLTKIESPNGNWVAFSYIPYYLDYRLKAAVTMHHQDLFANAEKPHRDIYKRMKINGLHLSQITTRSQNTTIDFITGEDRTDLPNRFDNSTIRNLGKTLSNIIVKNNQQQNVKHFKLHYTYNIGRLTLDSFEELPFSISGGTNYIPPYKFTYNSIQLPSFQNSVGSASQDSWGYYNANSVSLIPEMYDRGVKFYGGNRSPDADRMKAGILTQITYPNKGTTSFEYEPHDYSFVGSNMLANPQLAGGLRIKTITDFDGINVTNNIIKKFEYKFKAPDSTLVSSGVLSHLPVYQNIKWTLVFLPESNAPILTNVRSRFSSSVVLLGTTQGSHIGYRQVAVLNGANGESGKSESMFSTFYDYNDNYLLSYTEPYVQPESYDYKRGLLKQQVDYRWQNGEFVPVSKIDNIYQDIAGGVTAFKVGHGCMGCEERNIFAKPTVKKYNFRYGISKRIKTTETLLGNGGNYTTEQVFTYESTLKFLKKHSTKASDGRELITELYYPFDYNTQNVFRVMNDRHILSPVIEKIVREKLADNSTRVIDAHYTQYDLYPFNRIFPYQEFKFSALNPVYNFTPSVLGNGWPDFQNYERKLTYSGYTSLGNPQQFTSTVNDDLAKGDFKTSYVWNSAGNLPIAKIINAPFDRCAFTSFEDVFYDGNWVSFSEWLPNLSSDSYNGKRSFKGTISRLEIEAGEYVVSLWAKGNGNVDVNGIQKTIDNSWKRYEWKLSVPFNGSIHVSAQGNLIDDVRLHPKEAQMSTFNYLPHVGVSSVTDPNHKKTSYEYDNFGRLKLIRDNENNIITNYEYKYKVN